MSHINTLSPGPTASVDQPSAYLSALADRVLVFDGAMGTNIQLRHPTAEDFGGKALEGCNDHLVLTRPDIIQSIHESFLAVGCDVVETCTFQSTPHRLREWGIEDKTRELNVAAARLARIAQLFEADTGRLLPKVIAPPAVSSIDIAKDRKLTAARRQNSQREVP